jgi:hypothetical protein
VSITTETQPAVMLFSHGRTAPTSLPVVGLILAVLGGAAISQILQTWYAKIFHTEINGCKAMARAGLNGWRASSGFVALQVVIGLLAVPAVRADPLAAALRCRANHRRMRRRSRRLHRRRHVLIDYLE